MASAAPLIFDRHPLMLLAPKAWAHPKIRLCLLQASIPTHEVSLDMMLLRSFSLGFITPCRSQLCQLSVMTHTHRHTQSCYAGLIVQACSAPDPLQMYSACTIVTGRTDQVTLALSQDLFVSSSLGISWLSQCCLSAFACC